MFTQTEIFPKLFSNLQDNTIRHEGQCLEINIEKSSVQLTSCTGSLKQQWKFNRKPYIPTAIDFNRF